MNMRFSLYLGIAMSLCVAAHVNATTTTWEGATDEWASAGNWSDGVPDASSIAAFSDPNVDNRDVVMPGTTVNVGAIVFTSAMTDSVTISNVGANITFNLGIGTVPNGTIQVEAGSGAHTIMTSAIMAFQVAQLNRIRNDSSNLLTLEGDFRRIGTSSSADLQFGGSGDILLRNSMMHQTLGTLSLASDMTGNLIVGPSTELRPISGTTVNGGTLILDGNISTRGGNLNVNAGVLTGNGSIGIQNGTRTMGIFLNDGSIVNPGRVGETGSLSFENNPVNFAEGATIRLDLFSPADYDQLVFARTGTATENVVPPVTFATAGSGVALELNFMDGFSANIGEQFVILTGYDSLTGAFSGLADGSTFEQNGFQFQINYGSDDTVLTVIPEPSVAGLVLLGFAGFALARRRLRQR